MKNSVTMYEIFDKRTGDAITAVYDKRPVRTTCMSAAVIFIEAAQNQLFEMHHAVIEHNNIPTGAELDVRPIRGES